MLDQQMQQAQVLTDKPAAATALAFEWHQYASVAMMNLNELDDANLLEMLQALMKRRDELRIIDKQLFDLMAECFVRLKPAGGNTSANSCSDSSFGFGECNSSPASSFDDGVIDLSRLGEVAGLPVVATAVSDRGDAPLPPPIAEEAEQERKTGAEDQQRTANSKRSNLASPSLHFKKQRLLSAIISTDDIGEKQQVLAEKELDVRNDGRSLISNELQQSFKLIACNPSYQQLNQHQQEEYQQKQQQNQQRQLVGASQLTGPFAASQPAQYHDQKRQQQLIGSASMALSIQHEFDSGNTSSASDQDDDSQEQAGANERPQLKKFCSIGTAEMSFERFSRQQHLIDSTLATLTHGHHHHQQLQQQHQPVMPPQPGQQLTGSHLLVPLAKPRELGAPNDEGQLVQIQQQHHQNSSSITAANCFSIEIGPDFGKRPQQQALMSSMVMMPPALPQPLGTHNQPDLVHRLYDQFFQCQQSSASSGLPLKPAPSQSVFLHPEQHQTGAVVAPIHALQQQQQQQQQHHQRRGDAQTAFERLLVSAKDLSPLVRKMSFRCHVCSSCFEDRHRLQQHLSIHLNLHPSWFEEKTIKETMAQYEMRRGDYLCQTCQTRFETTSEFDKHMHLHGEKPHQCELCSQDNKFVSFRYFRQLLTHLRSHCFLYSCRFVPECRQTANRKDYLKLHILKHHLNNKLPEQYTICCH